MANSKVTNDDCRYATVDTDPVAGYFTDSVSPRGIKDDIFFSIRETDPATAPSMGSVMTVVLQFKCKGDVAWQTYNYNSTPLVAGDRFHIEDYGAGVSWRAGVEIGGYTEGSLTFGFEW
jgi:hypothetical protein